MWWENRNVPQRAVNDFRWVIITHQPGEHLRLVINGQRTKSGLSSFLFRLRRRLFNGDHSMSLSPLDRTPIECPDTVTVTDEFSVP
jgi:hypothetical protein